MFVSICVCMCRALFLVEKYLLIHNITKEISMQIISHGSEKLFSLYMSSKLTLKEKRAEGVINQFYQSKTIYFGGKLIKSQDIKWSVKHDVLRKCETFQPA